MADYVRFSQTPDGKKFYQSSAWRKCRAEYIKNRQLIDGGMCEVCLHRLGEELHHEEKLNSDNKDDKSISLNHDNLKWVCRECHFRSKDDNFGRFNSQLKTVTGAYFDTCDSDSLVLKEQKRILVYGSPFSGKSDYVKKRMTNGDFVINIESLFEALGGDRYNFPQSLFENVCDVRDFIYDKISRGEINARTIWIIESLPEKKRRDNRAKQLGAELVFVNKTRYECIERVWKSKKCRDKDKYLRYVSQWFEKYS